MKKLCNEFLKVIQVLLISFILLSQLSGCLNGCFSSSLKPEKGELVFIYPKSGALENYYIPSDSYTTPPAGRPLSGATDVPLSIIIVGTTTLYSFTINSLTFTMTVNDGMGDVPGQIFLPFDNSSVAFLPADFLKPNTKYIITASQTNPDYFTTATFTTTSDIGSNPAAVGDGYALVIGRLIWPPGIGGLVEPILIDCNLIFTPVDIQASTFSQDNGFVQLFGGEGNDRQTNLYHGRNIISLIGPFLGSYIQLNGRMKMKFWHPSYEPVTLDSINFRGKLIDWSVFGREGVGISDGSFFIYSNCDNIPPDERNIVLDFCTNGKYIVFIGSFYATPFKVSMAKDINGATLGADITSPITGSMGIPVTSEIWSDITTTTVGQKPCVSITNTTVTITLEDTVSATLIPGSTETYKSLIPGCNTNGNGSIIKASFSQTSPPLISGHTYKALTILDLMLVTGTTFTTQ